LRLARVGANGLLQRYEYNNLVASKREFCEIRDPKILPMHVNYKKRLFGLLACRRSYNLNENVVKLSMKVS